MPGHRKVRSCYFLSSTFELATHLHPMLGSSGHPANTLLPSRLSCLSSSHFWPPSSSLLPPFVDDEILSSNSHRSSKPDIFYISPPSPSQRYLSSLHQTQNSDFDGTLSGHRRASIQSHSDAQPQFYGQQQQYQPQYNNVQFQTSVDASYTMQQVMYGDVHHQPADPQYYQEDQQQQQLDPYYPHPTQADPNCYAQSHGTLSTVSPLGRYVPVDESQYSGLPAPSTISAGQFAREPPYTEPLHIATSQVTPTMYYPTDCALDNAQSNAVLANQLRYYSAGDMSKGYTQQYYFHLEATAGHKRQ